MERADERMVTSMTTKMRDIKNFLLVFDREKGELIQQRDFGADVEAAVEEYQRLERAHRTDRRYDIVLVGSDSIESVQVTHASYFRSGMESVEQYLRSVMEDNGIAVN